MNSVTNCLCGAESVIERKTVARYYGSTEIFKYKCPKCVEKELPWLRQGENHGALQEWNEIAKKSPYHKRTLEYNDCGVCVSSPFKTFEWRNKKIVKMLLLIFISTTQCTITVTVTAIKTAAIVSAWISAPPAFRLWKPLKKTRWKK